LNIDSMKQSILEAWRAPRNSKLKDRILRSFTWSEAAVQTLAAYQRVLHNA
jgi:hypothetical protein